MCLPDDRKNVIVVIDYDLAVRQLEVPASGKDHYLSRKHLAGDCIGCCGCESRCPFGVKIAERMKKTAELFGK